MAGGNKRARVVGGQAGATQTLALALAQTLALAFPQRPAATVAPVPRPLAQRLGQLTSAPVETAPAARRGG